MKKWFTILLLFPCLFIACSKNGKNNTIEKIDRKSVVTRNNPCVTSFDYLSSLSIGNGNFAFTADATGLQTFPDVYSPGVPLGTQSQWGWHSFLNAENYRWEETLQNYDFGRGKQEPYAIQFKEAGRPQKAADYFRANPHRMHLGYIGLEMQDADGLAITPEQITSVHQQLDLWTGILSSQFNASGASVDVQTVCDPEKDKIAAKISSPLICAGQLNIKFNFPYPTGNHTDDGANWHAVNKHTTSVIDRSSNSITLQRDLDDTRYFVRISWEGKANFIEKDRHYYILSPEKDDFSFSVSFSPERTVPGETGFSGICDASRNYWENFWSNGGFVDFSDCKDPRSTDLEKRVILSQYLMAIQCSGNIPPQETGLTYNSWFGKFHLEMHWWHAVHFALWNRPELMERSLDWYFRAEPVAREIAQRQGFDGIRWMKMTDPSAMEAPSKVGSFLIWQQPHFIYMAELLYRKNNSPEVIEKYKELVFKTAEFMASFATYEPEKDRYVLKGIIPAQETLKASETVNPPFELSYWHYALNVAQQWRERSGLTRESKWDEIIQKLSPLASLDGLYLAAETATDTYTNIRYISDHPAVLGALGILPANKLTEPAIMQNTLEWIWDKWNWDETWGWDYPMTAMCAARLGDPQKAVDALLMPKRTNTYLVNGHNYQDSRLRVYLPGNGGLLTAVAMMCAGWDNNKETNPGFPKDGNWNVKWEDLLPMP